jgi:hypothetical protein
MARYDLEGLRTLIPYSESGLEKITVCFWNSRGGAYFDSGGEVPHGSARYFFLSMAKYARWEIYRGLPVGYSLKEDIGWIVRVVEKGKEMRSEPSKEEFKILFEYSDSLKKGQSS